MGVKSTIATLPQPVKDRINGLLLEHSFSDYDSLTEKVNAVLKEAGFEVVLARSTIARYGKRFEERCELLRLAQEQAQVMKSQFADDEAAVAEMSLQMAQGLIFDLMLERGEDLTPKEIGLLTRALSDSSRSSIGVKKYQAEVKAKLDAAFAKVEAENRETKTLDRATLTRIREEVYGIF